MTYVKQIKDKKLRKCSRKSKTTHMEGSGFSHRRTRSGGHGKISSGQKQVGQGPTNVPPPIFNKDEGFNPKAQEGLGAQASLNCTKCGRLHKGECLASSNACLKYGKPSHQNKDCRSGGGSRT